MQTDLVITRMYRVDHLKKKKISGIMAYGIDLGERKMPAHLNPFFPSYNGHKKKKKKRI